MNVVQLLHLLCGYFQKEWFFIATEMLTYPWQVLQQPLERLCHVKSSSSKFGIKRCVFYCQDVSLIIACCKLCLCKSPVCVCVCVCVCACACARTHVCLEKFRCYFCFPFEASVGVNNGSLRNMLFLDPQWIDKLPEGRKHGFSSVVALTILLNNICLLELNQECQLRVFGRLSVWFLLKY